MAEPGDLLSSARFQERLAKRADSWLETSRLLTQPTVIFDRGVDEFWTTVVNSPQAESLINRIGQNFLIPVNADAAGDIGQVHTVFHTYLAEAGLATIPTIVNINNQVAMVGRRELSKRIPGFFVRKTSFEKGRSTSHGGAGVSVIRLDDSNLNEYLPKSHLEFLQPFVVPPDGIVRDTRVYLIDGKPVVGFTRRAREPLREENLSGKILPTPDQYPSAQHPGVNEPLDRELQAKVFPFAQRIAEVLSMKIRTRRRPYAPISTLGFASVDFLVDHDGQPLPVDFDVGPSVTKFKGIDKQVAVALADYMAWLSRYQNMQRQALIIAVPEDEFAHKVAQSLKSKQVPVLVKESLISTVLKEMKLI